MVRSRSACRLMRRPARQCCTSTAPRAPAARFRPASTALSTTSRTAETNPSGEIARRAVPRRAFWRQGLDTAQALFEQGQRLSEQGKTDEALTIFNGLLNRNFASPELLYLVADCLVRKGWN